MTFWLSLEKMSISEIGMPETDTEWKTWEEAQHALNQHLPGGGYDGGRSEYDPSVWMMGKHAPSHEKYHRPTSEPYVNDDSGDHFDDDDDDDLDREPTHYHVMTGHVDSHDHNDWTEHQYTMFEHPDFDYDPESAWDFFQQDHPEFNPERNIHATHEVKHVHAAEHHDEFHRGLAEEEAMYQRIAEHGLQRESPEALGHKAYRYEEPGGVVHRLWHSPYSANGAGWHTSRYDPALERHEQTHPWTEHIDNQYEGYDSLGDALAQIERNKRGS